jgi:hypothetical protein
VDVRTTQLLEGDILEVRGEWQQAGEYKRFFINPADMARAIDDRIRPQMIQWRKNKMMRAETGARLRVIRGLLGIRMQYTEAELRLPFVVPRIDLVLPTDDPDVKRILVAKASASMGGMYGRQAIVHIPDDAHVQEAPADDEPIEAEFRVTDEAQARPQASQDGPASPVSPGEPAGQSGAPVPPVDPPKQDDKHCAECGAELTDNVAKFSIKRFRKPLCWQHQQTQGGGAQS